MPPRPLIRLLLPALAVAVLGLPAAAHAAPFRAGEVVVRYDADVPDAAEQAVQRATGTEVAQVPAPHTRVLRIRDGATVGQTLAELRARPGVRYAVPNYLARASAYLPDDPGRGGRGNWRRLQWNFIGPASVNAPDAWSNLLAVGRPGGRGVVVAVLDTGVAYENYKRYRRSPDFIHSQFVRGHDFVAHDRHPDDQNGHGTFVAGVIAERTNNGVAGTGLAYGAKLMPVRVLDSEGLGDAADIAAGIRYAARRHAKVINLSLEFDSSVPARQIPEVLSAVRYAYRKGAVVVGASGNEALRLIAYPARAGHVISVGATTEHGCQADYSNGGDGLDIVAPGGGPDADILNDPQHCKPDEAPGRELFSYTFVGSVRRFGFPNSYEGTSMSCPHVAAAAALVIASGVIGRNPSPRAVENRLKSTARDLGAPGRDSRYGYGLLDAAAATRRTPPPASTP